MLGQRVTSTAVEAGHDVVVLVRDPKKLGALAPRVTAVVGDYFDSACQSETLAGADAVVTTIGPPMKRGQAFTGYANAMQTLVEQMRRASVKRIVAVGGAGVRLDPEPISLGRAVMRRVLILMSGPAYLEKEQEHNVLACSDLDWTILRPPQIAPAHGRLEVSTDRPEGMKVDPDQLASHMLSILEDRDTFKTAPFVATV